MSRSKRRAKPKMPGDGCFLCDLNAQEQAHQKKLLELDKDIAQADISAITTERR
jgi:hypothetical protein